MKLQEQQGMQLRFTIYRYSLLLCLPLLERNHCTRQQLLLKLFHLTVRENQHRIHKLNLETRSIVQQNRIHHFPIIPGHKFHIWLLEYIFYHLGKPWNQLMKMWNVRDLAHQWWLLMLWHLKHFVILVIHLFR